MNRYCEEEQDAYEREVYEMNFTRETHALTLTLPFAVSSTKKWRDIDGLSLDRVLPTRLHPVRFIRAAEGKTLWQAQNRAFFYVRENTPDPYRETVFSQERKPFLLYFERDHLFTAPQICACIKKLGGHIPLSFAEFLSSIITIHLLAGNEEDDDVPF